MYSTCILKVSYAQDEIHWDTSRIHYDTRIHTLTHQTGRFREIPWNYGRCREISGDTSRCREIPDVTGRHRTSPDREIPGDTGRYREISGDTESAALARAVSFVVSWLYPGLYHARSLYLDAMPPSWARIRLYSHSTCCILIVSDGFPTRARGYI